MTAPTPSERVLEKLIPAMEARGFSYRRKHHHFTRVIGPATQVFLTDFDGRGGLVSVGGGCHVTFETLEELFEQAVGFAMGPVAYGGFSQLGVKPYVYPLFADSFAAVTPSGKRDIDPALNHPPERIDAGVHYVLETYESHIAPLFDRVSSYRGLAGFLIDGVPGVTWTPGAPHAERAIPAALLLAASLGDDPAPILAYAEKAIPVYTGFDIRGLVDRTRRFIADAPTGALVLQ